ncbi:MAG: SAM-dependent DNA methyltransferase, partial [Synergistales bacterium]|nr:SAM-dependent DNA methyltransferase [Synergistales bacterium]
MFFNTGIATYIWILSNKKPQERKDKVQLINATSMFQPMRKSLGSKRKEISQEQQDEITRLYGNFEASKVSKVFDTTDFGFRRITVERPLQLAFYPHNEEKINALKEDTAFNKWDADLQQALLANLARITDDEILDRQVFNDQITIKLTSAQLKLVHKHIGEHNDNAAICTDKKGNP